MTRPDVQPVKRKALTKRQYGKLAVQQNGLCGCGCGKPLDFDTDRAITDEHVLPLHQGGSNDLSNRRLYISDPCAKVKTQGEAADNAKLRRRRGEKGQQKRRRERGASSIQGRGFPPKPENYKHNWGKRPMRG